MNARLEILEFDERDSLFVGHVLGLRAVISFHGETVSELRSAFEAASAGKSLNQWATEVLEEAAHG